MDKEPPQNLAVLAAVLDEWLNDRADARLRGQLWEPFGSDRTVVQVRDALDLMATQAAADEWTVAAQRSRNGAVRQMVAEPYPGTIERLWQLWREHRAAKKAGTS
jgi:hypothetical protein